MSFNTSPCASILKQFICVTACSVPAFVVFFTLCLSTRYFVPFTVKSIDALQWSFLAFTICIFLIAPRSEPLNNPYIRVPGIEDLPVRFLPNKPTTPRRALKSILFPEPYEYTLSNCIESIDHLTSLRQSGAGI